MIREGYCVSCGTQTEWVRRSRLPAVLFGIDAHVLRCRDCGIGRTVPEPALSGSHYEENERYETTFTARADRYRGFARHLLRSLDGLVDPDGRRLLDVGCGGGFLVEAARERGYRAEGIEANDAVVAWCRSRGLDVRAGDVDLLDRYGGAPYDVIVLSAILEHLKSPDGLLDACRRLLAPEGLILVSQASFDGLLPRLLPWGWYGWQPREHFWHFTPASLARLAARAGLQPVRVVQGSLHHPWFTRGTPKELIGRNLAAIVGRIGDRAGLGDSFDAILKPISTEPRKSPALPEAGKDTGRISAPDEAAVLQRCAGSGGAPAAGHP